MYFVFVFVSFVFVLFVFVLFVFACLRSMPLGYEDYTPSPDMSAFQHSLPPHSQVEMDASAINAAVYGGFLGGFYGGFLGDYGGFLEGKTSTQRFLCCLRFVFRR